MAWGFSFWNFDLQSARFTGCTNRAGGSPSLGGTLFLHRLTGVHEPRRRFALDRRQLFPAPESRGARTALACSPLTGGKFSAEPQRGIRRLRTAGASRRPPRGAKRKGHLRFPFLFELLPFPCFLIWRRFPICDRFENRERQRIFSTVGEHSVLPCRNLYAVPDTVLLHIRATLRRARHDSAAQFVSAL